MNTIRPKPYLQRNNGNYNSNNDGADKDGHNQNGRENQEDNRQIVARRRAQDVQQQTNAEYQGQHVYSPATSPYPRAGAYGNGIPSSTYNIQSHQINPMQYQSMQAGYQQIGHEPIQQGQVSQSIKSNKVNIAQILRDFRNTMKAIATPEELEADVNKYLEIVDRQVRSAHPQVSIIQGNLKTAATLLDKYISETLNKTSKVVQNWLDALFLQRINYSYDEGEINPAFLVKFPDRAEEKAQSSQMEINEDGNASSEIAENVSEHEIVPEIVESAENNEEIEIPITLEEEFEHAKQVISHKPNITVVPQDTRLKSLFLEAKKQAFSNNPQKAMSIFKEAFSRAEEIKDTETQSRICLEIGKIYDDNDFVVQALNSYNKSLQYTTDTDVKSKAHFSIAQIYDDVNQVSAALDHYITSISYAGKTDDLIGQSDSLTRVANIYADKYDEYAFEYYDVAKKLVEQTTDSGMKGYVLSNTADACVQFKKNDRALKYYAEAVKNYEKANSPEEIAQNYKAAAALMINFNSPNKAKSLLKKAMVNAVKTGNDDLISEINMMLSGLAA
ncbi:MAG: hypothetical protein MJ237_01510 [bacterium]|nr:hypothetical protein [bacterium]